MGDNGNMMSIVSISLDVGYLHLKGNPGPWIEENPPASHLLVKCLHLDYEGMKDDEELQIGESIGNLSELTELTINGAEFLKCLPKSMAALKKLRKLVLEYCINLPDNFEVLMFTSTLTCLELLDCDITSFPKSLTFLFHLTSLFLFQCEFLTELPSSLFLLSRLTHISVKYCERLQSLPCTMAKLLNLKKLSIKGCASLTELPDYLKVTHLKLINSSINFIPSYLINLSHLHVSVDFLLEALFENLKNSVYLYHLSIECDDSEVEAEIPKLTAISNQFVNLQSLSLNSLFPTECVVFPVNLDGLDELILLDIRWTEINYIPWTIADLKKLRFLLLPAQFRLALLPFHLNDSVLISVPERQSRKTWQEIKQGLNLPVVSARDPSIISPPGYIPLQQDLGQWICDNYKSRDKSEPSGELFNITQLYISPCRDDNKLPLTITGLRNLSIEYCGLEFHSGNLAKLYNLETLDLIRTVLPTNMDYPIGLRHLVLNGINISSLPDNIAQLSNLITLEIFECNFLQSLPTNLNIVRLKLDRIITTLPVRLLHLEIFHMSKLTCGDLKKCLTQLVNLETLSITSYRMESFPSIVRQHKLKLLQLIDCFSLRQLPPDLGELMELDTLNISGTKIKSLPDSIMKLPKLQHLILPRCFKQESLPKNLQRFIIDDTSEIYYKHVDSTYEGNDDTLEEKDGWKKFDGNEFFSSFHEDLVSCVLPFIERYSMVKGDGNCGFRAIAVFEYCDEEKWLNVRQDLKEELTTHEELYKRALGGEEELKKARDIVDWSESPAPMKHWYDITRLGLVVATKYQKICTYWTKEMLKTILPLESRTVDQPPTEYINLASIWDAHLIPLQLRTRNLPLPPLMRRWENHCNTAVKSLFMSHFKKQLDYFCQLLALNFFLAHPEILAAKMLLKLL